MIVDHANRYIFVSVPKTGSISCQFSLGYGHDIPEPDLYHAGIAKILADNPGCDGYFKFAVVRNPWARLISLYHDFTKKRVDQYSAQVKHDKPLLSEFKDFEDLCLRLPESSWYRDVFFRSQVDQLSVGGQFKMDMVGRFESLEADFKRICGRIGLGEVQLQKHNVGACDHTSYRKYYTEAARDAVARLYGCDAEMFGYEF